MDRAKATTLTGAEIVVRTPEGESHYELTAVRYV